MEVLLLCIIPFVLVLVVIPIISPGFDNPKGGKQ